MIRKTYIIPVFNCLRYLPSLMDSLEMLVAEQSSKAILIEDFSTDGSREFLKNYTGSTEIEFIFNNRNLGASNSRNLGASHAEEGILIFQDADDISLPTRANIHESHLQQINTISFVSSSKVYRSTKKEFILEEKSSATVSPKLFARFIFLSEQSRELGPIHLPSACMAIHTSVFRLVGGFDEKLKRVEDVDFLFRAFQMGLRLSTSSSVAVIRGFDTAMYKSGKANEEGELTLLQRYWRLGLSNHERRFALYWTKAKGRYFDRQPFLSLFWLFTALIISPFKTFQRVMSAIPKRLFFDFRNMNTWSLIWRK